jgi:hypothetical protein
VCKDFWTCVFKKQIDNLRTNHQGVYVLQVWIVSDTSATVCDPEFANWFLSTRQLCEVNFATIINALKSRTLVGFELTVFSS